MKKLTFIFILILFFFISCKKSNNESLDYEIKYSEYDNGIIINGVSNKRVENITIPKRIDGIEIISIDDYTQIKNGYVLVIAISEPFFKSVLLELKRNNIDKYILYGEVLRKNNIEVFDDPKW